jgi:cytochrome c553
MKHFILIAAVGVLGVSGAAIAGDSMTGRNIVEHGSLGGAPACASCHGSNLQGGDAIKAPSIAGKPAAYIVARLDHYASPEGHNAMMKQVANALSISERQAVATYISYLPSSAVQMKK